MNAADGKQGKWSRWTDDKLTDDEDSGSQSYRRIVNEAALLGKRQVQGHRGSTRPSVNYSGEITSVGIDKV